MDGKAIKLLKYLDGSDKRFIIPVYQRNYSWKVENCRQLYDDLVKLIRNKRKLHFFGSLVSVYNGIQEELFKNSVLIENIFKTKVSYVLAQNLGVEIDKYLDPKEYIPRYKDLDFFKLQSEFYKIYMKYDRQNNIWKPKVADLIHQPTRHYFEHHNHIPPWIIMRNLSFSNTINLYRLIKSPHKDMISDLMLPNIRIAPTKKSNFMVPAISLIREFRNQVAHNLKFVNHTSSNNRLPTSETNSITKNKAITSGGRALNDIFACTG